MVGHGEDAAGRLQPPADGGGQGAPRQGLGGAHEGDLPAAQGEGEAAQGGALVVGEHEVLGAQDGGAVRGGPGLVLQGALQALALDVDDGQLALQERGQPPGPLPQGRHEGGDEGHAHDEGVGEDADGQPHGDGLDVDVLGVDEGREDAGHNDGGGAYHLGAAHEPGLDGLNGGPAAHGGVSRGIG